MMKGINLVPDDIKRAWRARKIRGVLIALACTYLAILGVIFFVRTSAVKTKMKEVENITRERDALVAGSRIYQELTRKLGQTRAAEGEFKTMLTAASGLSEMKISWSTLLRRLSRDIPENVWLRSLSTSDLTDSDVKRVRFNGSSTNNKGIAAFVFVLENGGYFHDVNLSYSQKRDFKSTTVYDFEIFATLTRSNEVMYGW